MDTKESILTMIKDSNGDEDFTAEQMKMINDDTDLKNAYDDKFGTEGNFMGGKKGKKGTKKRKEPSVLASWRKFVRKVQHEENITYPKAMKRASKRKSEWQRGGADMDEGGVDDDDEDEGGMMGGSAAVQDFDGKYGEQYGSVGGRSRKSRRSRRGGSQMMGGSRRRRGTKKRRGSRRR